MHHGFSPKSWLNEQIHCKLVFWKQGGFLLNPSGDAVLYLDFLPDSRHFASPMLTVECDQRKTQDKTACPVPSFHLVNSQSSKLPKMSELLGIFNLLLTSEMATLWGKIWFFKQKKLHGLLQPFSSLTSGRIYVHWGRGRCMPALCVYVCDNMCMWETSEKVPGLQ